jgi:PAS domain-containing protein
MQSNAITDGRADRAPLEAVQDPAAPTADPAPAREAPAAPASGDALADPAQIARLFEMTSDLLATISPDGRFVLLNPAWERLLDWTRDELQACPITAFLHPDDVDQHLAPVLVGSRQMPVRRWPRPLGHRSSRSSPQIITHGAGWNRTAPGNFPDGQLMLEFESKYFFDLTHGFGLSCHWVPFSL